MINLPTLIIAAIIAIVFVWIVAAEIRNRRQGKHFCSCGGSCDACGMNCSRETLPDRKNQKNQKKAVDKPN